MAGFYNCLKSNNDCIMAARTVDLIEPLDGEESGEEFSRKKKSKFQTFKNFFAKKKKKSKELSSPTGGESKLKTSQSSNDVNFDSSILHLPAEPGPKGSMGNKALSHDSIFIFESLPDVPGKTSLQENLPGKVKALQLRLQQNLRLGSAPLGITGRKAEALGALSKEGGLPRSPPEISALHAILAGSRSQSSSPAQHHRSLSLAGTDSEDEQVNAALPSPGNRPVERPAIGTDQGRPLSPLPPARRGSPPATPACRLLLADFNSPAIPLGHLDTSAARHRIAINPRKHKAFASRSRALPVEKEQHLPGTAERKAKLLEVSESQEVDWKGPSIQNARNLSGTWTNKALPVSRACDALRYSWNAGPGTGGICASTLEDRNLLATDLQASIAVSCPKALSSLTKHEGEEEVEEDGGEETGWPPEDLALNPWSSRNAVLERTESLRTESVASGLCEVLLPVLRGSVVGEDAVGWIRAPCPQLVEQQAEDSSAGSDARPGGGSSSGALEAGPAPQGPSSTLEAPSEAEKVTALALGSSPAIKEDVRRAADVGLQLVEGCTKPTAAPWGMPAILDAGLDGPLLQSAVGETPCLPRERHCAVLSGGLGEEEADPVRKLAGLPSGGLPAMGAAEDAPQSSLPHDHAGDGDHSGGVEAREGSPAPDENPAKSLARSASAKPVRFTIAPAWQRSLSGGSHPAEGSGTRSAPSSPIRPELFKGMPLLEPAAHGCGRSSPEGLEGGNGDITAHQPSALEGTRDKELGHESPFGVKLRRTSSLLKYQAEQQPPPLPPKQPPPLLAAEASSVSVIEAPTPADPGTPLQTCPAGTKALATRSGFQEDRNPPKAKGDAGAAKPQAGRPSSEHTPAGRPEAPPSRPVWISMAKQQQKGFRGPDLARRQRGGGKPPARAEHARETGAGASQWPEKDVNPTGEDVMKKSVPHHLWALERGAKSKVLSAPLTKAVPVWAPMQETPPAEAGPQRTLSLPLSSCSGPAEPPWLSLAKKKSKAWSEMPQIVQ
ncbi:acrosomal protein KIAA1210 homolog [Elgaria multicarinata webbii]|uniref:acrosomal protein KIAA1210 homolog n=1 Tax=Elgaria multicarinata webbii TaxID=159646 RepID=UPI002FCCC715